MDRPPVAEIPRRASAHRKFRILFFLQRREREGKFKSVLHSHQESNLRNAVLEITSRYVRSMQYVNDVLVACPAGTEYLREFDRMIPHCSVIGIVVKLLLHDFIEHVFSDVARVSDIDCHMRDCSNAEVRGALTTVRVPQTMRSPLRRLFCAVTEGGV